MSLIIIVDGPAAGRSFQYPAPTPNVVVLAEKSDGTRIYPKYHDYRRVDDFRYRHAETCPGCTKVARPA